MNNNNNSNNNNKEFLQFLINSLQKKSLEASYKEASRGFWEPLEASGHLWKPSGSI